MSNENRPRRQRKADRLTCPGSSDTEIACDYAMAPFDRAALEMDRKWGVDRLPELVTPETALKYGKAIAHLNSAINENDPDKCAAAANNCIRGLSAMDAEAIRIGRNPIPANVWIFENDGKPFGVVREAGDWATLMDQYPTLTLYTLREVANSLTQYKAALPMIQSAKAAFPGATIAGVRSPLENDLDDEIPW